ncbi:MAG TPA: hypothetical protein VJT85_10560 [Gemmatimonadaceae bacterium]|nr:hypothetical protein [Gemmatimonadaceae bacterium]
MTTSAHRLWARLAPLALALALMPAPGSLPAQGGMRQLYCRGINGISLKVDQDPSPRDAASVVMVLEYRRPSKAPGSDVRLLEPGTCTWNPLGVAGVPAEPGRVRFDVRREAQPWSLNATRMMDTTVGAARFFPDPITLPRYLNDPKHYWVFFVNDATNLSSSFGSQFDDGQPAYVTINGPIVFASDVRRDLLCRGGSAGLLFGGGTNAGSNLAKVIVTYRTSANVPGASGSGLSPGSCAWTDRAGMPKEPGRIAFITARNAQLKQAQNGAAVDHSPTAAERWADVSTIPEYLKDPAHFWLFKVASADPDSALSHGPWHRNLTNVVATGRPTAGSTSSSVPTPTGPGDRVFRPGGAGSSSALPSVLDIRNVTVKAGLEGVAMSFDAAPNSRPTVTITPAASNGAPIQLTVGGTSTGAMWRYSAASPVKLARDTRYTYVIAANATGNAPANQATGGFTTLKQLVTVFISRIDIVSDGDTDGNGDLTFQFQSCPDRTLSFAHLAGPGGASLNWTEGPQKSYVELKSISGNTPDQIRVLVLGFDDDYDVLPYVTHLGAPSLRCDRQSLIEPGRHEAGEWNSAVIDLDLTKYPGVKAGDSFVRRSKPLRNGSTLAFEIRGSFLVTRQ